MSNATVLPVSHVTVVEPIRNPSVAGLEHGQDVHRTEPQADPRYTFHERREYFRCFALGRVRALYDNARNDR